MGKKVLLADDSATIQKLVEMALSDSGFELLAVSDGKRAVEQLIDFQPDIVLADAIMPLMDGYEVCEHVKADEVFGQIPVVLLTGRFQPYDERRAQQVGIDFTMEKPFSQDALVTTINRLLAGTGESPSTLDTLKAEEITTLPDEEDDNATVHMSSEELNRQLQDFQTSEEEAEEELPHVNGFEMVDPAEISEGEETEDDLTLTLTENEMEDFEVGDTDEGNAFELSAEDLEDSDEEEMPEGTFDTLPGTVDKQGLLTEEDTFGAEAQTADSQTDAWDGAEIDFERVEDQGSVDEAAGPAADAEITFEEPPAAADDIDLTEMDDTFDLEDPEPEEEAATPETMEDEVELDITLDETEPMEFDFSEDALGDALEVTNEETADEELDLTELSADELEEVEEAEPREGQSGESQDVSDGEPEALELEELEEPSADEVEQPVFELEDVETVTLEADEGAETENGVEELGESDLMMLGNEDEEEGEPASVTLDETPEPELSEEDFRLELEEELNPAAELDEPEQDTPPPPAADTDNWSVSLDAEEVASEVPASEAPTEELEAQPWDDTLLETDLEEVGEPSASDEPLAQAVEIAAPEDAVPTDIPESVPEEEHGDGGHDDAPIINAATKAVSVDQPQGEDAIPEMADIASLSDSQLDQLADKVAARLVHKLGRGPVREIIWQVVPELAEAMIKKRIYQIENTVDQE